MTGWNFPRRARHRRARLSEVKCNTVAGRNSAVFVENNKLRFAS